MMTRCRYFLMLPLIAVMSQAYALDMKLSGKVVANPCTVDVNTVNRTVELPNAQVRKLVTAGTGGEWADFTLEVNQCPAYLTFSTVRFTGTPDTNDATAYANTGTGTRVALQLGARTTIYGNGTTMRSNIDPVTHKATFPLSARIYSPTGGATIGTFASSVNVTFTYQ